MPLSPSTILRTELLTSTDALAALRPQWRDLWDLCPWATPFQSPEWLIPWWVHLGRGRLHVVAWWDGERLVGLAPCFRSRYFGLPLTRLALLGTGNTDYLDLLVDPLHAEPIGEECARGLAASQVDFCDFQQLRGESPFLKVPASGQRSLVLEQEVCPVLSLPEHVDGLADVLPRRLRENIRYYRRRLEREGLSFGQATAANLDECLDALFDLHTRRWRTRRLPGVFHSERTRRFHREAALGFLERRWLRLHLMRLSGRVVAALYCFVARGRGYYYAGGFDPALGRWSPGTVLTALAIEDAIRSGATEFDFLRGNEPYKYGWGAVDRVNRRVVCWAKAPTGAVLPRLIRLEQGLEAAIKNAARRAYS